jgi:glycosyltransferase involved in cell wall biosynthesis
MKVAVDSGPLKSGHRVRGVGFYTKELTQELQNQGTKRLKIDIVDFEKVDLGKFDVLHYPYFNPFFLTLPRNRFKLTQKIIVTIHDLTPLIYPKQYPPGLKGTFRYLIQKNAARKADAIITDSEASKKDIVRFLGVPSGKIFPIHLAPASHFRKIKNVNKLQNVKRKYKLPSEFVLYVGDVNYNKNIPTLAKACKVIKRPLVIVGKQAAEVNGRGMGLDILQGPRDWIRYLFGRPHPELAHYEKLSKLFRSSKILKLGFVDDKDLVGIYNLATVYCQPSFYEGFGLPVLEAMACGTPVVISRTQALVEVSDKAALIANPNDAKDMADKIKSILMNRRTDELLREKGLEHVKKFTWEKTARETLKVYKSVIGSR